MRISHCFSVNSIQRCLYPLDLLVFSDNIYEIILPSLINFLPNGHAFLIFPSHLYWLDRILGSLWRWQIISSMKLHDYPSLPNVICSLILISLENSQLGEYLWCLLYIQSSMAKLSSSHTCVGLKASIFYCPHIPLIFFLWYNPILSTSQTYRLDIWFCEFFSVPSQPPPPPRFQEMPPIWWLIYFTFPRWLF